MDAFSGYNQIRMNHVDEEHTAFTTDKGLYCYQVMPFGLKNAGATYQRLVNSMFEEVIGTIMEVYVDDMLVKSLTSEDHVTNLSIVFTIILRNGMRLNPQKCIFGVEVGKFLGYIISHRGIEANPEKVQAILDMHVEVIAWTAEHEAAFLGLKAYLSEVPLLYKPVPGEMLYIYLAASSTAVSSALIRKDSDCEYPVYYAGKGYTGAESRYPDIEKIALALLVSARKLRHYFQAHSITVFTNHPLRQVLQKPETSGRLIKWAIELGEFDIKYQPQTAIKGQAAADFISESIPSQNPPLESPEPLAPDTPPPGTWRLYVDGASNKKTSRAGILLISPDDQVYEYALKFAFKASNNTAEYEALIAGLQIARELGVSGNFEAKEPYMSSYQALARALVQRFTSYIFTQIPRAENDKADALAKLALTSPSPTYGATKVEVLERPSTSKTVSEIFAVDHTTSWMDPILKYMVDGLAPDDKVEARRLQLRSARYTIMNDKLYRRGHCFPNLKCVTPEEGHKIMKDIHAGVCGNHAGARSLAHKTLRAGYFWPTMSALAQTISSSCHKCQMYANIPRAPPIALSILLAPWPFCQWGLDLIGKLPTAVGQFKYAIVAVDYQTKWIEAEPLVAITTEKVKNFLWKNIYCRTTATEATGETPFCMAFGSEAVLPIETQIQSPRIEYFDAGTNQEGLQLDADLLEERRDVAHMHNLANKRRIARYYDAKVQSRTLKLGDWVMKQVYPEPRGLDPSWTGPYEIIEEVGPATFFIRDMNGAVSRHPWNTQRLRYYYK
ncbi:uncharacterized protein LOC112194575 [Rosa chinensis]|uniref:uncharacterized protein LOC112194575 n=1 Tax=Rosa chinensis TaxID=74649 RepID=UPI000D09075E|nr:uncharacterized protein LOC112194575 [Rosa chinensis]